MVKWIKGKLAVKIFLGTAAVFISTFFIFFISVQVLLPTIYEREFQQQSIELLNELSGMIEESPMTEVAEMIDRFSLEHNANVTVEYEGQTITSRQINRTENSDEFIGFWISSFNQLDETQFSIKMETSQASVNQVKSIMNLIMPVVFLFSLFISIAVALVYSRLLARPIVKISKSSKRMSQLDLSERCDQAGSDEIGELAGNLNHMAEKLEKALADLQSELEQRSNLYTAISHELKTPITILKGELRGMIDGVGEYENRDYYLEHAYQTTETMERLVHDILMVSNLERAEMQISLKSLNLSELVESVCESHEALAQSRNIVFAYYCEAQVMVLADETGLQKAIANIVSNAIFHSKAGEMVDVQLIDGILTVENSGAYIAEEDLAHLFEPFYRTDKSRNRYTGGSGLGLYIVKNILDLHHAHYRIENNEEGVVFTVRFPLLQK